MNLSALKKIFRRLSISSKGARYQFEVAIALISILPLLVFLYLGLYDMAPDGVSMRWWLLILALLFTVMCLGFTLLIKYPRTIVSIRDYLKDVAEGEMPEVIHLMDNEKDITAIEKYFNIIIEELRQKVKTIEQQREKLLKAERQRVMTETICATCHHIGQPATSITCYLELLRIAELPDKEAMIVEDCAKEINKLRDLLIDLQSVTYYETEPYVEGSQKSSFPDILKLKDDARTQDTAGKMRRSLDRFLLAFKELHCEYKVGSTVELTNGAVAMIKQNQDENPSQAFVKIVIDENGDHPDENTELDLSLKPDISVLGPVHGFE